MGQVICLHSMTSGKEGEAGSWCVACGKKSLELETRGCQDCLHCKEQVGSVVQVCTKKHLGVMPSMKVAYKVETGTCWQAK